MSHDSTDLPVQMESRSKPVLVLASIAAGATVLTGGLAVIDGVPSWLVATVALVGAVATAVGGVWTKGQVTPWADVAAKQTPSGKIVFGPAGDGPTGTSAAVVPKIEGIPAPEVVVDSDTDPVPGAGNGMNPPYPGL
jgi:hypothetical protein